MMLFELSNLHNLHEGMKRRIKTEDGEVVFNWKTDLEDEEGPDYLPDGYSKKVLELSGIFAKEPGKGQGERLMKQFLSSPEAKKAELIFLDRVPNLGKNEQSEKSEDDQVDDLGRFYARFGFRSRTPRTGRMWLVQRGEIPDNRLPT